MKLFSKTILACSFAAATMFSGAANAAVEKYNLFTVDPVNSALANFSADKITGNYTEIAKFGPDNTFSVELWWTAGQFVTNKGTKPLNASVTGLGYDYNLLAFYTASGTYSTVGDVTTFNFIPSSTDSLKLFLDTKLDTTYTGNQSGLFTTNNTGDDVLIGRGTPTTGNGSIAPETDACINGIFCGGFGATSAFQLTAEGAKFFIAPTPFYTITSQSGQLNRFTPSGIQIIDGSLDVTFNTQGTVPEPASLGLMGLGLLGLGFLRSRKQS